MTETARAQGIAQGRVQMRETAETAIRKCAALDESGYICEKSAAIAAIRALPDAAPTEGAADAGG